jgi:tetratricopeptide (TPR) repeat protein
MAIAKLAMVEGNLDNGRESYKLTARALSLKDRLTERERLYVEGAHYSRHPRTFREVVEAYRLLAERYHDESAHNNLATTVFPPLERYEEALVHAQALRRLGSIDAFSAQALVNTYLNLNRFQEADEAALEVLQKRPDLGEAHHYVGIAQGALDRPEEAIASFRRARELSPENDDIVGSLWEELVCADRFDEAESAVRPLTDSTEASQRARVHSLLAHLAGYRGRSRESAELFTKAAEMGDSARAMLAGLDAARVLLLSRNDPKAAIERAEGARKAAGPLALAQEALYWKARALAGLGKREDAARAAAELRTETSGWPNPAARRRLLLLDADLLSARGDKAAALASLAEAEKLLPRLEKPFPQQGQLVLVRYGLAAALVDAGRDVEAAPLFEFVTRARLGRIYVPMLYVRSFYFLGRIVEKKGEKAAARKHYERFLFYWKDGDTDRDRVAEAQRKVKSL